MAAWLLPLPLLALVAFQVLFSLRYQDARAAGDGPPLQVRHARALIDQSRRLLAERPDCRLVGLGHGERVDNSDLALLVEFTDPARVLLADGDMALPLPSPSTPGPTSSARRWPTARTWRRWTRRSSLPRHRRRPHAKIAKSAKDAKRLGFLGGLCDLCARFYSTWQ